MDERRIAAALSRAAAATEPTLEVVHPARVGPPGRVGLLSGSFDPMTVGHAALAEALHREACDLVLLVFSVATLPKEVHGGRPPEPPLLEPVARVASLLAFARSRRWAGVAVASHGLLVDQAEPAARRFPGADILVGIGSDKLLQLLDPAWYEDPDDALERLFGVASVGYAVRAGDAPAVRKAVDAVPRWRDRLLPLAVPAGIGDVSSRAVRTDPRRWLERAVPPEVRPFVRATRAWTRAEG